MKRTIGVMLLMLGLVDGSAASDDWRQWRGPTLNGVSDSTGLPTTWSPTKNIVWKAPLPAWGGSTPIVTGDRVFVTSPSSHDGKDGGKAEVVRRFRRGGRENPGGPDLLLMCFSRKDGSLLWQRTLDSNNKLFGKQNMASPSPITDGQHVWALTGTGVLTAFDLAGTALWRHALQEENGAFGLGWGYASSPLYHHGKVIVQVLHGSTTQNPSYVVAFDGPTGKRAWKIERKTDAQRECPDAYTTPTVLTHGGKTELVISGADYVTGHDPETGAELWRAGGLNPAKRGNYRVCGTPVAIDGLVYATSRVRPLLAFRAGGRGDITTSHLAWKYEDRGGTDVPSIICDGKRLYMVNDKGIATCLNAKTGEVIWGPERTALGTCSASPVLADGKLYITNESGVTTVLRAGSRFEVLATNDLEDSYTIASMAVAGSQIFLRTSTDLYCIAAQDE